MFRAPRDFLLQVSGNPDGRIVAYDPAGRRVRVSAHNPWWIPCSELQPQAVACAQPARPKTRSIMLPPQASGPGEAITGPDGRGVPSCRATRRGPKADYPPRRFPAGEAEPPTLRI